MKQRACYLYAKSSLLGQGTNVNAHGGNDSLWGVFTFEVHIIQ